MFLSPVVSSLRTLRSTNGGSVPRSPQCPFIALLLLSSAAISGYMTEKWPLNLGFNVRKLTLIENLGETGFPLKEIKR